jgi:hypothetical protein
MESAWLCSESLAAGFQAPSTLQHHLMATCTLTCYYRDKCRYTYYCKWKYSSTVLSLKTTGCYIEYFIQPQSHNIVTCQPFVGLRNRALLGNRPVNKTSAQTRWCHATVLEYGFYATCHGDVTRHRSRGTSRDMFPVCAMIMQHKASRVVRLYDWVFYKRNRNF